MHLAEGFLGYNMQSYPVGMMAAWPTGWWQGANAASASWGLTGSYSYDMWPPEIRNDTGYDDNYSLWYRNTDQIATAVCHVPNDDLNNPPTTNCPQDKKININQAIDIAERAVDPVNPQHITVRFKYRALNLNTDVAIKVRLLLHESVYSDTSVSIADNNQLDYGYANAAILKAPNTPADGTSWGDAMAVFTLDPALHHHPQHRFDRLKFRIESDRTFEGRLAFDNVSLDINGIDIPLVNPKFDGGFQQLSGGDSATTFLSRLNGTAFWGNISHHEAAGHSFDSHPYETLIYFLRGLPLGDAVWFAETHNSGILYGDPLYSPVAIYLHRLPSSDPQAPGDHFLTSTPLALQGDTYNGAGPDVTTTYSIDYCSGADFLPCDKNNSWSPVASIQNRPGGSRNMSLGSWDVSALAAGDYILRLAVTSTNAATNLSQTFYDYYPLTLFTAASDADMDGLTYAQELNLGTNPWNADSDADGLPDGWEVTNGLDPLYANGNADSDSDGFSNYVEYSRQSDPTNPNSVPAVSIHLVDPVNGSDDGQTPFQTIHAALIAAQAGDTISLAPGVHQDTLVFLTKPVRLEGQPDHNAIINTSNIWNSSIFDMEINGLTLQTSNLNIYGRGLHFKDDRFIGNTAINNKAVATITNSIFTGATLNAIDMRTGSSATLDNVSITNNAAGIRASTGSNIQINNSIISGNTLADVEGVSLSAISYSLIGDPAYANISGNTTGNPQFVDSANGDYHLRLNSPAVDAGDPASDYSREPVSVTGRINMGAYGNTPEAAADSDGDGTENRWELTYGLDPNNSSDAAYDIDGDGLTNLQEYNAGTNPGMIDSDNDGLRDDQEINIYGTNPANPDTDKDKLPDGWELSHGLNPLDKTDANNDIDNDGLTNLQEYTASTDLRNPDTDSDGTLDGSDDLPLDPDENTDTDSDGIGNNADTDDDNDGMPDNYETRMGFNPLNSKDAAEDADGDGYSNRQEFRAGSDPLDPGSTPHYKPLPWLHLLLE